MDGFLTPHVVVVDLVAVCPAGSCDIVATVGNVDIGAELVRARLALGAVLDGTVDLLLGLDLDGDGLGHGGRPG